MDINIKLGTLITIVVRVLLVCSPDFADTDGSVL